MSSIDPQQPPAAPMPGAVPGGPAPQQWAWVRPQQVMQTVETEPLEYHRLLRGMERYRWYKPLLLLLLSGVYFGIFSLVVAFAFAPLLLVFDPEYAQGVMNGTVAVLDTQRPLSVLLSMLSVIVMIPAVVLAMLSLGIRPIGRIWSVATRIRWGLLWRLTGVSVLAVAAMQVVGIAADLGVQQLAGTDQAAIATAASADFDVRAAVISAVLVLLLVPIQATAEEVVFRGLFMQVLGSWLKSPWFGILIPSILFALGHIYDIWGLTVVGLLGAVSAWLTWRTGGLEAGIAIHIVNNLVAFGFMVSGIGATAQTESGAGLGSLVGQVAGLALYLWLTVKVFRSGGYGRTRIDLVTVPAPPGIVPGAGAGAGAVTGAAPYAGVVSETPVASELPVAPDAGAVPAPGAAPEPGVAPEPFAGVTDPSFPAARGEVPASGERSPQAPTEEERRDG